MRLTILIKMKPPCVLVIGPTGVGKSDLMSDLNPLSPFVFNCDSMQIYNNLPIASACPSVWEEGSMYCARDFIVDDLLSSISTATDSEMLTRSEPNLPSTFLNYTVKSYCEDLRRALSVVRSPARLHVLCGGSMNYVSNIIDRVLCEDGIDDATSGAAVVEEDIKAWFTSLSDPLETLGELSPNHGIHPSDQRQIRNALLRLRSASTRDATIRRRRRLNRKVFVIYIDCSDDALLVAKIRSRIEKMVAAGLESEINAFYDRFVAEVNNGVRGPVPNVGLFQAIGFKEFLPYLTSNATFDKCLVELERTTMKFVKYQRKYWKNNMRRMLSELEGDFAGMTVDAGVIDGDGRACISKVVGRFFNDGVAALDAAASGIAILDLSAESSMASGLEEKDKSVRICCDKTIRGETEWRQHIGSRLHKTRK